jgi:hypothetical protein
MLSWQVRYGKILDRARDLFDTSFTVLEVGPGSNGIAPYVKRRVVGLEPQFSGPLNEWLVPVNGTVLEIPFSDNSFDIVLCVDVFGHLSKSDRSQALNELVRVARNKVLISCPCGQVAEQGERALLELFKRTGSDVPSWLEQHLKNGLPTVGDMFAYLANTGLEFEVLGNETIMQHYAGILLDHFFPFAHEMQLIQAKKSPTAVPIGEGNWDYYYSFLFTLQKNSKDRPTIEFEQRDKSLFNDILSGARIYCVYHKPFPTAHLGIIKPVFAGEAADLAAAGDLTDITKGEVGLPNERWAELSAYYRIWREGPRSEVVGFCHYRRLFNFRAENVAERETNLWVEHATNHSDAFYDKELIELAKGDVVICPRPIIKEMTNWDQYCLIHNTSDLCWVLSRICNKYPCLVPYVQIQLNANLLYPYNIFITNWALFDEICSLWFDLLRDFERATPKRNSTPYQGRVIGFLAERVFDAWIRYRASIGTRIIEVPIFFLREGLIAERDALIGELALPKIAKRFLKAYLPKEAKEFLKNRLPGGAKRFLKAHLTKSG